MIAYPDTVDLLKQLERRAQLLALEHHVVETAKQWYHLSMSTASEEVKLDTRIKLGNAIKVLERFEELNQQGSS